MQYVHYLSGEENKLKFKIPTRDKKSVSGTKTVSRLEFGEKFIRISKKTATQIKK
jgi:hypothetical protein